jgi:hypothetical protein
MQEVPKIVRARLRAAKPDVAHPDADLLTAFSERSLPPPERDAVLDHLARCGDCRDIVALALPATEPVQTVISPYLAGPARSGWLTWPALRWAFVAAGIVAIASIGILKYQKSTGPTTMAYKAPAPQTTRSATQPTAAPVAPPPADKRQSIQSSAPPAFADSRDLDRGALQEKEEGKEKDQEKEKKTVARLVTPTVNMPQSGGVVDGFTNRAAHPALANQLPHGPRLANQANQWQQNTAQNQVQNQAQTKAQNQIPALAAPPRSAQPAAGATLTPNAPLPQITGGAASSATAAPVQTADAGLAPNQALRLQSPDDSKVDRAKPLPLPAPGQFTGYVVDPSGAVVANARITVIPSQTGAAAPTTTVTNAQGAWLIAGLPSGSYKARADAPGFSPTVLALNYDASRPSMYSVTLSPGSVSETVEVAADSAVMQTETASVGGSISGRDLTQLAALSPGAVSPAAGPRWSITSTGQLQRSFDQGKTWQIVDVTANSASFNTTNATSLTVMAAPSLAKAKAAAKAPKHPAFMFRALSAAGAEVWGGGSDGLLYHSSDAGNQWTRIVPASSGAVLTGDIVAIEFADPQHGKLSTSTAEVWTTSDNGQTWRKQ